MNVIRRLFCTFSLLLGFNAIAGDFKCYDHPPTTEYTSTTDYFACTPVGNCTWWAAYKRPDLAAKIDEAVKISGGGGWNGGQWYDRLKNMGVDVGSEPMEGDIVEFYEPGHVAYVSKVHDDGSFSVSEMDSTGSFGPGVHYAKYTLAENGKYRRNSGGLIWDLKGFIHKPISTNYRLINETVGWNTVSVAWAPANVPCDKAQVWSYDQVCSAQYNNAGTCNLAYNKLNELDSWKYGTNEWYTVFFGSVDDFSATTQ